MENASLGIVILFLMFGCTLWSGIGIISEIIWMRFWKNRVRTRYPSLPPITAAEARWNLLAQILGGGFSALATLIIILQIRAIMKKDTGGDEGGDIVSWKPDPDPKPVQSSDPVIR